MTSHRTLALAVVTAVLIFGASWQLGAGGASAADSHAQVRLVAPLIAHEPAPAQPATSEEANNAASKKRSGGCGRSSANAPPGSTSARELVSGGVRRTYRVHISTNLAAHDTPATAGAPLVLLFHGRGGSGQLVENYSGLVPVSDREGFILVSPNGVGTPTTGWNAGASGPSWPTDDVQFGRDLLATLKNDLCIDPTRVYATGHSNGAFMAARLACAMGGAIVAIAPVAGVSVPAEGCPRDLPVIAFHGTWDDVVPFAGGKVRDTSDYSGAERQTAAWAAIDGCATAPVTERPSPHVRVVRYEGCRQPVTLVLAEGAGHEWPGGPNTPHAAELATASLIWAFFRDIQSDSAK